MPIFRFYTYANKEVFENNIDQTAVYGEKARKKLSEIPKQIILPSKDIHDYTKSNGVGFENEVFGNSLEFYIWENLSAKLVAHPRIDTTFALYGSMQAPADQEEDSPQEAVPHQDQTPDLKPKFEDEPAEEDIGDKHPFPADHPADVPEPQAEDLTPPA